MGRFRYLLPTLLGMSMMPMIGGDASFIKDCNGNQDSNPINRYKKIHKKHNLTLPRSLQK